MLSATLTNNTSKAIRHVGVWVNAEGINGAGRSEVEYEFEVPLAPHQTRRNVTGKEYDDSDQLRLSCESELAQSKACRDFKAKHYRVSWPSGLPTISPLVVSEDAHLGPIEECWARLVMYADGTGWSVSPL
jgi:hypothetical protein